MSRSGYIPALRFHRLTHLYDGLLARTLKEEALKRSLIIQAAIEPGMRVLDLGCGTATLSILIKQAHPGVEVHGLDADRDVLTLARSKAAAAGMEINFALGYAQDPPFEDETFDRVLSSLVFHHLAIDVKRQALTRAFKLLKPGGELHIADWGKPKGFIQRLAFLSVQFLDGFKTTGDSVKGILPRLMAEAGFQSVEVTRSDSTLFGTLVMQRGLRQKFTQAEM